MAATVNAARVFGAGAHPRTIEVGKWADLILLDGDPFEDIRNTRRIRKVIQSEPPRVFRRPVCVSAATRAVIVWWLSK